MLYQRIVEILFFYRQMLMMIISVKSRWKTSHERYFSVSAEYHGSWGRRFKSGLVDKMLCGCKLDSVTIGRWDPTNKLSQKQLVLWSIKTTPYNLITLTLLVILQLT